MRKLDLILKGVDNGFCRVYYTNLNGGDKPDRTLYAMQQDWTRAMAEKYGHQLFNLYVCSRDGEPSHTIPLDRIRSIDVPTGDSSTERELIQFLNDRKEA